MIGKIVSYFNPIYKKAHIWRLKYVSDKRFMLFLSFVVGLLSGLAAVILKNTVHYTYKFITDSSWFTVEEGNFLFLAYPMIGIFITVLFVKYFIKDDIGHGISKVLYAISRQKGQIKRHNTYSSMVASTITVAFGGSVGLEAPIVSTGSALGSNLGKFFRMNYRSTILLIGCGAAGAVAGIFKAPIAGIVFVIEVLLFDLTTTTIIHLLISSITAASLGYFFMGHNVQFSFKVSDSFALSQIPFYIILGLFCSLVSLYFLRMLAFIEKKFSKIKKNYKRILIGGIILGVLIFIFPPLFGEGYPALTCMLNGNGGEELLKNSFLAKFNDNGWILALILLAMIFFKVIATASTTGGGGVGGVFAPSLFLGGVSGFFIATVINLLGGDVSTINFSLVGMAAVMTGVMQAPLTAIFLIAEITGGYELFAPLMVASTISYLGLQPFEKSSIYTKKLAMEGNLITHNKDKSAWQLMDMEKLIETNFSVVSSEGTLRDLTKVIEHSHRNVFPVLDRDSKLVGLVAMDDIRPIIFRQDLYDVCYVKNLMIPNLEKYMVDLNDSMETIINRFKDSNVYNLAVVEDGYYRGFISRANVFSEYRSFVSSFSVE